MTGIRVPAFPDCAEPCKACDSGDGRRTVWVVELPVRPGDRVAEGDVLAVVETNKTTVEVRAERAATVTAVLVAVGEETAEDEVLMVLG